MVEAAHKTLVLGRGFLGKAFEQAGFEVWGKENFQLLRPETWSTQMYMGKMGEYDTIINCIGKSNTRWCEKRENFQEAMFSNGVLPGILSDWCAENGKRFVHVSTGCLYDEEGWAQGEDEFLAAHCQYTLTKWVGEVGCRDVDLILRPRLYFGDTEDRNNLLCKLPGFTQFVDEYNSYTSVNVIVEATVALLTAKQTGVFNVACQGAATVRKMAQWIGLKSDGISGKRLRDREGLYLVNNVMNVSKLMEFYTPPWLLDEVMRCWEAMKQKGY